MSVTEVTPGPTDPFTSSFSLLNVKERSISLPDLNIGNLLVTFDQGNDKCTSSGFYHKTELKFVYREKTIELLKDPEETIEQYLQKIDGEEANRKTYEEVEMEAKALKRKSALADQKRKNLELCKTNEVFNVLHKLRLSKYYKPISEDGVEVISDFFYINIADYGCRELEAKRFKQWLKRGGHLGKSNCFPTQDTFPKIKEALERLFLMKFYHKIVEELGCASLNELEEIDVDEVFGDDIISLSRFISWRDKGGPKGKQNAFPNPSISSLLGGNRLGKYTEHFECRNIYFFEEIKFLNKIDVFPAGMTKVERQRMREVVSENFPQLDIYMKSKTLVPQVSVLKVTHDDCSGSTHDRSESWHYRSLTPIQEDDDEFESSKQVVVSKKNRKVRKKRGSKVSPILDQQAAQRSEGCGVM